MGYETFVSGRGVLSVNWRNKERNFIASGKELLNGTFKWNQRVLTVTPVKKYIKWIFNPLIKPHLGGVRERLLRSFNIVFYAMIGNRRLTDDFLKTNFSLVEQSFDARPPAPASANATEMDVLTPNHFLLGAAGSSLPSSLSSDLDYRKRYARAQAYSGAIWSRWLREYVPTLNSNSKWSSLADRDLKTGDLVWILKLLVQDNFNRFFALLS